MRRFLDRARAGLGGVTDCGTLLAMMADSKTGPVMTMFHLALRVELLNIKREPTLGLSEIPPPAPDRNWEAIPW